MRTTPSPQDPPKPADGAITRRRFFIRAGGAAAGIVLASRVWETGPVAFGADAPATVPDLLPIPQRLAGSVIELEMAAGQRAFSAGLSTPTKGYNGDFLGPTLVLRSGSDVELKVTNHIGVTTTTHWHGMHVPAAMDGGPHQAIEPGETWPAAFRVMNRAGTYWYHPHAHAGGGPGSVLDSKSTGYQVYEGLAGMLIVEDEVSDALPLPRSYGQDDIPLIIQDRRFNADGSFRHFSNRFRGAALRKGGHFLVNGVEGAVLHVGAQIVRLRVLNGSNSRVYNLGFSEDRVFSQVASDGGFLSSPVPMSRLVISPGERAELLIDLGADEGQTLMLGSYNAGNGNAFVPFPLQDEWDTSDFGLLQIQVGPATADAVDSIPASLVDVAWIPESEAVNAGGPRPIRLGVRPFGINGRPMDMSVINQRISLGDTEVWEISNPNPFAHPFHVHGDSFQILSRDGVSPPEHELGWKDVVLTRPFETVRIIKRFRDFADPDLPYMYHCHILEHEDAGMMGQWVVEES
jgi:bilirubin oxidase